MGRLVIDERVAAIHELMAAADEFAQRAELQETCRDRSRPGTGSHHQHAHSATLWRLAQGWYDGRLERGYQRREPVEAHAYFAEAGLAGPFWGLD